MGSFEPDADPPVTADELGKRVGELEGEVRALRASVSRLQNAGKTVIAQREEWKARALVAEPIIEGFARFLRPCWIVSARPSRTILDRVGTLWAGVRIADLVW